MIKMKKQYLLQHFFFMFYNRSNLQTVFNKNLIIDALNAMDIFFDINNINFCFEVNQCIKFRLYLTKNKLTNDSMKKEFIHI